VGQAGELAHRTRELRTTDTPQATIVVDLTPVKPAAVPRGSSELRIPPRRSMWPVVLVYVIATAALALSIYTRFF
jgi:hypothetical protein